MATKNSCATYYIAEDMKTSQIVCCTQNRERAFEQAQFHKKKTGRDCSVRATGNNYLRGK